MFTASEPFSDPPFAPSFGGETGMVSRGTGETGKLEPLAAVVEGARFSFDVAILSRCR